MVDKKWFKWTSLFGFIYLYMLIAPRIRSNESAKFEIWARFIGKFLFLIVFVFGVPVTLLNYLLDVFRGQSYIQDQIVSTVILVLAYLDGVFITDALNTWRKRYFGSY